MIRAQQTNEAVPRARCTIAPPGIGCLGLRL
jgi:hypothetical protein